MHHVKIFISPIYPNLYDGWVFQKPESVMPQNSKIGDWMSFPGISLAHAPETNQKNIFNIIMQHWMLEMRVSDWSVDLDPR